MQKVSNATQEIEYELDITKWIEGEVVREISDVIYDVKLDCNDLILQGHIS